ncbi:uncharacterized protein LOC135376376 [Ornithodoros turicata]|uniref:uncharacterized protein LOC135376376 n=1 Tax=Ornithodoros turicata TaxID=34597 RepID=UPI003139792D
MSEFLESFGSTAGYIRYSQRPALYTHSDHITSWSDDIKLWPNVTSGDIVYYLINSKVCDLQEVKAYKSLESYRYLQSGWVGKLLAHKIDEDTAYVKGEVRPSQAVKNKPQRAWSRARYSGVVLTGGCTCMAGQAKVCSHVGALLWKIDLAVCKGLTGITCTDRAVEWNRGTKRNVEPAVLQDITFKMQRRTVDADSAHDKGRTDLNSPIGGEDYPWLSASPDGLIDTEAAILEIKCPHVGNCETLVNKGSASGEVTDILIKVPLDARFLPQNLVRLRKFHFCSLLPIIEQQYRNTQWNFSAMYKHILKL